MCLGQLVDGAPPRSLSTRRDEHLPERERETEMGLCAKICNIQSHCPFPFRDWNPDQILYKSHVDFSGSPRVCDFGKNVVQPQVPSFQWTSMARLGGGAIFWSEALLDALTDERVMRLDWNRLAQQGGRSRPMKSCENAMQTEQVCHEGNA